MTTSQTSPPRPPPPSFTLTYPPSLESYNTPASTWLATHNKTWDGLATAALVFSPANRILLLQRAAHDSMPNLWETPGGAADPEDASLFAACARELWEEAGLTAARIVRVVTEGADREPGSVFTNRTGKIFFCRFAFEVEVETEEGEVEGAVRIDPEEHQDFVWATEEEVRAGRVGDKEIPATNGQMMRIILDGFRRRREEVAEAVEGR